MSVLEEFSGIVLNQNVVPGPADFRLPITDWINQEFFVPVDYLRGTSDDELRLPELSGFQLCVEVPEGYERAAAFDWDLQYRVFGIDWITLDSGTTAGAPTWGERVWMNTYFNKPINIGPHELGFRFRIGIKGHGNSIGATYGLPVQYDGKTALITTTNLTWYGEWQPATNYPIGAAVTRDAVAYRRIIAGTSATPPEDDLVNWTIVGAGLYNFIDVTLEDDKPYPFMLGNVASILLYDSSEQQAFYYVQQGPTKFWYSTPNPLASTTAYAREDDGITALGDYSLMFRVLGLTADEGTDFLGNRYRSAVITQKPDHASTRSSDDSDKYWLSKPNPSRFAVENLYFDLRAQPATRFDEDGNALPDEVADVPVVVDRVLLDPFTPGMYFHIYYSDEGEAGNNEDDWNNKLWKAVPKTYRALKREVHVLPQPIAAKYIKVEFSQLQARSYAPGDFARPITYIKHPKWVLGYFLARLEADQETSDDLGIRRTGVIYNALDIAYNYYLDDLNQEPDIPVELEGNGNVNSYLLNRNDVSDQVDADTLSQINLAMRPYADNRDLFQRDTYLLGQVLRQMTSLSGTALERGSIPGTGAFNDIQALRSRAVAFENDFPVMFFYLTCRHGYRKITSGFTHDRAYFAGINEIAFTRENYTIAHDNQQYTEPGADLMNVERNDFKSEEGTWVV